MSHNPGNCEKAIASESANAFSKRLSQFMVFATGVWMLAAADCVLESFEIKQELDLTDPIFGITFRHSLLIFGLMALLVPMLCLLKNSRVLYFGLLWLSVIFAIYRIGLWTMGLGLPYPLLAHIIESINLSPKRADVYLTAFAALLLIGSGLMLYTENQRDQSDRFPKMPCPACGGHIRFPAQNLGQQIPCPHCKQGVTLRKPSLLKMSCFFCKNHIEFPAHSIGTKLKCPHCSMDVTLREPYEPLG